ncbi:MAG: FMN-binding protein [Cyclobacteriaceae bacterium]
MDDLLVFMRTTYIILLLIGLSAFGGLGIKLPKSAIKKMDKSIKSAWAVEEYETIQVSLEGLTEFKLDGNEKVSVIKAQNESIGFMVLSQAYGKYDFFDLMVLYDNELKIKSSAVLVYREDFGGEIGSGRWLRQFVGKDKSSQFKLDEDVQGISGATISVRSATREFKRVTSLMEQLKKQNKL